MELLTFTFRMMDVLFIRGLNMLGFLMITEGAIRVPMFYAYPNQNTTNWMAITPTLIVAMLFGGIHCTGWNFPFPSHAELIIWRVSSLIILIVPWIGVLVAVEAVMDDIIPNIIQGTTMVILVFGLAIYVLARLTLFVVAFIALRHLPPGAYAVVEWTALLLHM